VSLGRPPGRPGAPGTMAAMPTADAAPTDELALGDDLRAFVDASPSPSHAVAEMARRLTAAGFTELAEVDRWELAPGAAHFAVRRGGSMIAFRVGSGPLAASGMRLVGAHTDSPTFKVRPNNDVRQAGYRLVGVEPYGGALLHTWLDRELTVAGRVALRGGRTALVRLPGAPLRLPSLAIHLDRSVREGLTLDPQRHLVPVWSRDLGSEPGLAEALAEAAGVAADDVVGHDLVLTDTQPAARAGGDGTWIAAPRLDDLACCHSGLTALLAAPAGERTQVLVCNDHEEVGSGSMSGARGSFLEDVVTRLVAAIDPGDPQALHRTVARSVLVSADMGHAVHPTRADRHEPAHTPQLGGGPVVKLNANQAYATDALGGGWFTERCATAGVPVQHFLTRADLPCGSTIGPLTATRLGIATVDVGAPMLAMHSCRELASALDVPLMVGALTACLAD
jgi:aspartyl aminopeptidase